ncbi:MAG: ABC transporter permease [Acidobacteriaceae bacterium]|nr:ABC transporter permease [Acidobacteriaceae bacterium]
MFLRLVYESFRRQKRRKALAGVAIMLGVGVATAMIAVATDVGDKISRELRTYGANLLVTPQEDSLDLQIGGVDLKPPSDGAYLNEADLPKIRGTFWHHNIVGFAPMLPVNVDVDGKKLTLLGTYFSKKLAFGKEDFATGVRITHPWWKVQGAWPEDESGDVLIGESLAGKLGVKPGDEIQIGAKDSRLSAEQGSEPNARYSAAENAAVRAARPDPSLRKGGLLGMTMPRPHRVSGILSTGAAEDGEIVAPLKLAQQILGKPGAVRRLYVSAMTKPEDALARRDPKTMNAELFDRWYCSPYVQSIAYQLQEAIPHSHAEQIRQVAQTEGTVLSRIQGLMLLITLAALLASALAVSAAMATAIFERRGEVGLMKALGAGNTAIAGLFFVEAALLALIGGVVGFGAGAVLARQIGRSIFDSQITIDPVLLPVILTLAVIVTFAGSALAIRRAVKFDPVYALRGEA